MPAQIKTKQSYIPWLGEVPEHWELTRNKWIFKRREKTFNRNEMTPVLSLTTTGVKVKRDLTFGKSTESYIGHQLVYPQEIIFSPRDYDQTPILSGVSKYFGCISNLYRVLVPSDDICNEFVNYFWWGLKHKVDYFKNFSNGIRFSFNKEQFDNIFFLRPPLVEQKNIVRYLDAKLSKLDALMEQEEQKLRLLVEKQQALIDQTIARGFNATATLGWKQIKLKHLGTFLAGYSFKSSDFITSGTVRVLKIANVQNWGIDWTAVSYVPTSFYEQYGAFKVLVGDLVFALTGSIIASGIKACIVPKTDHKILLNQRNSVFRPKEDKLLVNFLYHLVRSSDFIDDFKSRIKQTNQPNISTTAIGDIAIKLPTIVEQQRMIATLSVKTGKVAMLIEQIKRKQALLQEYRRTLIADVVTGQRIVS